MSRLTPSLSSASDKTSKIVSKEKRAPSSSRRKARELGLQALYQWHMAGQASFEIEAQFRADNNFAKIDAEYFHALLTGVIGQQVELDAVLEPYLDRPLLELDPIELTVLRLASFELKQRLDVPYRVVINEAIELTKVFGATDGHKFVNGMLDKIAPKLRSAEAKA